QSTTLTAAGGGTYIWSTGATTASISVSPTATTNYTVTVTSGAGCVATASQTVTVNPLPSASISGTNTICTGQSTTLTAAGGGTYLWSTGATTASISVSPTANTNYTVTVTSVAGCSATAFQTVVVQPATSIANAGVDQLICGTSALLAANTPVNGTGLWSIVSGTGGSFSSATNPAATFTGIAGNAYTLRWTISNSPCNPTTDDVVVTFNAFTTANAGPDQFVCGATATLAGNAPITGGGTWTLVSGSGTITTPTSPTSGITALGVGPNTFRWTLLNGACANSQDDVVITRDNISPVITCPANISVNATTGLCAAAVTFTAPNGTDNCSGATTTQIAGLASGSSFPVGTTTNTFRVTDASGNTATCSFTVTVIDNQAPVISCPANISVNATTGLCAAAVTFTAPNGTDNCSGATTTQIAGLASGASFPVGTTTNTFRVTDASGNTATCSFTVTVVDNQAPVITCPANISVNATTGLCAAAVTFTAPNGTDNCSGATTTQIAGLASGSSFPVGTTTNTFRVTDASG
ncbi:MAG TPA: HYR domain-containing protein, partial [Bacteroidia bacterium]|nr:HYR domain-containing protein [Bacteroidia bacterium]